jgi:hypothetical protein
MKQRKLGRSAGPGKAAAADSPAVESPDQKLIELGREFLELEGQLARLEEAARAVPTAEWTTARERLWLAEADPIRDRMFGIAVQMVSMPAHTRAGLRAKARVLLDTAHGDPKDLIQHLAASLSRDILELSEE